MRANSQEPTANSVLRNQHGFYVIEGRRISARERALWRGLDVACVVVAIAAAAYFGSGIVGAWLGGAIARAVSR